MYMFLFAGATIDDNNIQYDLHCTLKYSNVWRADWDGSDSLDAYLKIEKLIPISLIFWCPVRKWKIRPAFRCTLEIFVANSVACMSIFTQSVFSFQRYDNSLRNNWFDAIQISSIAFDSRIEWTWTLFQKMLYENYATCFSSSRMKSVEWWK